MSDKEENNIGLGWNSLIEKAKDIETLLSFAQIASISKAHCILKIKFADVLDKQAQYVLDCISYKIERESAKLCEECGKYGMRRHDLSTMQVLCTTCYTLKYNAEAESVSPQVTNQEPQ
jgi:hypothetical protein